VTGALHFQVHPCAAQELLIDPLFEGALREGALYPDGAHITDLKEVRDLLYKMQRPAMAVGVRICFLFPFSSLRLTWAISPRFSWCTCTTRKKRTSPCSIIVACYTPSLAHLNRIKCARFISAILLRRMNQCDPRRRM